MFSRFAGAAIRALCVVLLIALPSVMLPATIAGGSEIVSFIAIAAAILTFIEYKSDYPSLIEFRFAPPFNRIRFGSLFFTVLVLSIICSGKYHATPVTEFTAAIGQLIAASIDFPFSPVRLVVGMLPADSPAEIVTAVRTAAGISYLTSLLSLAVFLAALRLSRWPRNSGTFNVWINLPMFDPTAGGDVVRRLNKDARFNIMLGFLLPFIIPVVVRLAADFFGPMAMTNPQILIWTMAAWAFLPASLFMRGIAMSRVAHMIADQRRRTYAAEAAEADDFLVA